MKFARVKTWTKRLALAAMLGVIFTLVVFAVAWFWIPFPVKMLDDLPRSPVVTDRHGTVMLDLVGEDDQWRLPVALEDMSPWLMQATIAVEDERFRDHPGVDALAVARAMGQNIQKGRVVSGASTITMQVCRMLGERPRTLRAKIIESFRATQLEQLKSKDEILAIYLNLAPYGGNLRGVEAASLAYFNKSARHLSLGEAALLAGLPQSPSRYRPDRFPGMADARRGKVLARMVEVGFITQREADEAAAQPLVIQPRTRDASPFAMQAGWHALRQRPAGGRTTIDLHIQERIAELALAHVNALPDKTNAAVVVIDIQTGHVLAMVGSVRVTDPIDGKVNGALAMRSPGSTLKPFVYAAAMDAGRLNRDSVLYDGPIERAGWSPGNFDRTFAGMVNTADALQQSLNVPAILVAEGTGLNRCIGVMHAAGIHLAEDAVSRGGLAVVVGSVETNLLSLTNAYATLGRSGKYRQAGLFADDSNIAATNVIRADVCAALDDMLSSHVRRPRGMNVRHPDDLPWFMWKTGTSSGRRDAWAVGHNGRVAIGVWIGRFDGSGHTAYVGGHAAEPLLAQLFDQPNWRTDRAPLLSHPLAVQRPLPMPRELAASLRIMSPTDGSTFIAIDQHVPLRFAANQHDVMWFLDGKRIDVRDEWNLGSSPNPNANAIGRANASDPNGTLVDLSAGHYHLVCTDSRGASASVRFRVK